MSSSDTPRPKPVALIILDGFGMRDDVQGNAVAQANKPNFDRYMSQYPNTQIIACGEAVGLPEGQMGNSEVGHLNIGAGRIVYQSLTRISKSIRDGEFFDNGALLGAVRHAKASGTKLHLFGLLSDGGVHSHIDHLFAMLEMAKREGLNEVYVHAFLDGRDVAPDSAPGYMQQLIEKMAELGVGQIASVHGRYYAMDRDKRWDRVEKSYRALVVGDGPTHQNPLQVVKESYEASIFDEFVVPTVIVQENGQPVGLVESNDAIVFYNFRPDRAIQLSNVFATEGFNGFELAANHPKSIHFVSFTAYHDSIQGAVAFEPINLEQTFGEVVRDHGLKQLRIAETEKYPHVTYFFSGGRDVVLEGETRALIASPKVATYDLKPEMSAYEVAERAVQEIESDMHDAIILNFANPDMVGHSGLLEPTIKAVEVTDECMGKVVDAILAKGGAVIIIADHGNADIVRDEQDLPQTAHTLSPVPFIITVDRPLKLRTDGILADVAPTMLQLLNLPQPVQMTGRSMIID